MDDCMFMPPNWDLAADDPAPAANVGRHGHFAALLPPTDRAVPHRGRSLEMPAGFAPLLIIDDGSSSHRECK